MWHLLPHKQEDLLLLLFFATFHIFSLLTQGSHKCWLSFRTVKNTEGFYILTTLKT